MSLSDLYFRKITLKNFLLNCYSEVNLNDESINLMLHLSDENMYDETMYKDFIYRVKASMKHSQAEIDNMVNSDYAYFYINKAGSH